MIYIIRCNDAVKVGFSVDPLARIKELQTGNPQQLEVIAVLPGTRKLEKEIHAKLSQDRISGEWFRFTSNVARVLESIKISSIGEMSPQLDLTSAMEPEESSPGNVNLIGGLREKVAELRHLPVLFDHWLYEEVTPDRIRYRLRWKEYGKLKSLELPADDVPEYQARIQRGQMLSHINALLKLLQEE